MIIWSLAWRSALARRRLFAWNIGVPALLLTPVALSEAAAPHRTAVFGVFFVFFATFGSAIPAVRDARSGWLDTVFQSGYSRARWMGETVLAGSALDFLQLAPVALVLVWTSGSASFADISWLLVAMLVAVGTANLLGPLIAAAVRSLAETALVSAAASLLLLHFAGFFRTPTPGWSSTVARLDPYHPLLEALAAVQDGPTPTHTDWIPAVLGALVLACLALVSARRWTARFEWPHAG